VDHTILSDSEVSQSRMLRRRKAVLMDRSENLHDRNQCVTVMGTRFNGTYALYDHQMKSWRDTDTSIPGKSSRALWEKVW
jgi:hypothetical protein